MDTRFDLVAEVWFKVCGELRDQRRPGSLLSGRDVELYYQDHHFGPVLYRPGAAWGLWPRRRAGSMDLVQQHIRGATRPSQTVFTRWASVVQLGSFVGKIALLVIPRLCNDSVTTRYG